MMGWQQHIRQRDRLEQRRRQRLQTKLQKAGAVDRQEMVTRTLRTWNRRFAAVAAIRACGLKETRDA